MRRSSASLSIFEIVTLCSCWAALSFSLSCNFPETNEFPAFNVLAIKKQEGFLRMRCIKFAVDAPWLFETDALDSALLTDVVADMNCLRCKKHAYLPSITPGELPAKSLVG